VKSVLYAGWKRSSDLVFELFQWSMLSYNIKHCNDAKQPHFCQHSSAFTVNSKFQHLFKHSAITCTTDCLSMILIVLEDGPIKVPKQLQYHFAGRRHNSDFLGPGWCFDICLQVHSDAPMFHCPWQYTAGNPPLLHNIAAKIVWMFPCVSVCAHL